MRALGNVVSPGMGLRATIVSACGTGKALMGAHTALRVARSGRVLVLVPRCQCRPGWRAGAGSRRATATGRCWTRSAT
ncbi:hypothetical protein ACFRQM_51980 [Streptomyces sp. NPDC056831]|uniref:hypothetical protein n=1 Tax=Streptomyces sp. NPDC056831 TaxID=3345954 RepID=UPI003698543C